MPCLQISSSVSGLRRSRRENELHIKKNKTTFITLVS